MKYQALAVGALALATASHAFAGQEQPLFAHGVRAPGDTAAASGINTWTFKWTYQSRNYSASIVGNKPHGGAAYTAPVVIFPVSLTCGSTTYSALDKDALSTSGATVLADALASPMFQSGVDFKSGGHDFGSTQYIDAYQRADLFGDGVKKDRRYHLLLGTPTTGALIAKTVPSNQCSVTNDFGVMNINANINWFDANVIQPTLSGQHVPNSTLAIFVTTQTYLTSGGCCIGGYHSENGSGNTYAMFTYIQKYGAFSQDVGALSHEIGEWVLDPFVNNSSPCGILENGDPLEREANYGDFPYTLNGFLYHLQDLVTLPYFGAPPHTSVNKEFTFQGTKLTVCQNGS